ncbi:FecCD family ABC transporter permease [Terrisporobacter glycolicus]|uniref:Probable heme-iron transport system permease protein IsdF n=1 Tax=Terrisporobacter glycolicus ATCC 14880 = DSM 1288 TaxID=1121315 RepID=A0ABZ2EUI5_9FIRM|nr:iron ABC transporter permease [Terrisporobacter glycolicus]
MSNKSLDRKKTLYIVASVIFLFIVSLVSMKLGSLDISYGELIKGIFINSNEGNMSIIRELRFPRIIIAVLVGGNLAICGVLLQVVVKNPLADPGITGISAGASLVAVLIMVLFPGLSNLKPILAFCGGLISALLVFSIAYDKGFSPLRIILAGVAINAMLSAMSSILTTVNSTGISSVTNWLNGSLATVTWSDAKMLVIYSLIGVLISFTLRQTCNLMSLGDKTAKSLGVNINKQRVIISAVAVFLASISTGVAGIISFVGLIVPHIGRFLIGSDHKYLIPFSFTMGAILLLIADTVGRCLFVPYEIPVGLVMSVIGGPFFIFLLRRSMKKC